MAVYDARSVSVYLASLGDRWDSPPYDTDKILNLCLNRKLFDAAVWILEKKGDTMTSLDITLGEFRKAFRDAFACIRPNPSSETPLSTTQALQNLPTVEAKMQECVINSVNLCKRTSLKSEEAERIRIWSKVLDEILQAYIEAGQIFGEGGNLVGLSNLEKNGVRLEIALAASSLHICIKSLVMTVIPGMVGYVSLSFILDKLLAAKPDPRFGEFRQMIFAMMEGFSMDREVLDAATLVAAADTHVLHARLKKAVAKSFVPSRGQCLVCRRILHVTALEGGEDLSDTVTVFRCGHSYHGRCLVSEMQASAQKDTIITSEAVNSGVAWCVACDEMDANGARALKRTMLIERVPKLKGKSNEDRVVAELVTAEDTLEAKLTRIDVLLEKFGSKPTAAHIFHAMDPVDDRGEIDRIEMNDANAISQSGMQMWRGSGDDMSTRQTLPAAITALLSSGHYDLALAPPN
ncbi:hypothetical protein HDU76_013372 [Blyttiomyces sp. JEL0837]|nr:hypothetical protein HDU76_013372 [Blyttiomyces sp. JEL0837]